MHPRASFLPRVVRALLALPHVLRLPEGLQPAPFRRPGDRRRWPPEPAFRQPSGEFATRRGRRAETGP